MEAWNVWFNLLHDAFTSHAVSLFVDALHIPEALLLVLIIGPYDDGDDVEVHPQARAQGWAHVLDGGRKASTNELGKVLVLISGDLGDDVFGNEVVAHLHCIVECDVLDGEVQEIDSIMNSQGYSSGMVIGEDSSNANVEGVVMGFEVTLCVDDGAHLSLTVCRCARREPADRFLCCGRHLCYERYGVGWVKL